MRSIMLDLPSVLYGALEVLSGVHGTGEQRKQSLKASGYDAEQVQKLVNELVPILAKYEKG